MIQGFETILEMYSTQYSNKSKISIVLTQNFSVQVYPQWTA